MFEPHEWARWTIETIGVGFMLLFGMEALVKIMMYTWKEVKRAWREGMSE